VRLSLYPTLRRVASAMMLAAMVAFVQQGAMIIASQAAAAGDVMPHPATMLSGTVHFHDNLAVNVHVHGGGKGAGHVHGPADVDHDDTDEAIKAPVCSVGHTCAVLPAIAHAVLCDVVRAAEYLPPKRLDGVEPDGLSRPPSTPGIA
jgi:hypothetical protein